MIKLSRGRFTTWILLAGVFLIGFAVGRALQLGSILLPWLAFASGVLGISITGIWQAITGARAFRIQRAQHEAEREDRDAAREQARHDLAAIANQASERSSEVFRRMPETPVSSWFDWALLFAAVVGEELRRLFLEVQRASSAVGGEAAITGREVHADFLSLEETVRAISTPTQDSRSPAKLVDEAVCLRGEIRRRLAELGTMNRPREG